MSNPFDWVPLYKELAQKLLPYRQDRENLIRKVQEIFAMTGISMPSSHQQIILTSYARFVITLSK